MIDVNGSAGARVAPVASSADLWRLTRRAIHDHRAFAARFARPVARANREEGAVKILLALTVVGPLRMRLEWIVFVLAGPEVVPIPDRGQNFN